MELIRLRCDRFVFLKVNVRCRFIVLQTARGRNPFSRLLHHIMIESVGNVIFSGRGCLLLDDGADGERKMMLNLELMILITIILSITASLIQPINLESIKYLILSFIFIEDYHFLPPLSTDKPIKTTIRQMAISPNYHS